MNSGLRLMLIVGVVILVGCARSPTSAKTIENIARDEAIIKSTKDPQGLVDYFKAQLSQADTPSHRYKLAEAYLAIGDHDSAAFYLEPLAENQSLSGLGFYLLGRARAGQGEYLAARFALTEAIVLEPSMAQAFNLLGVIDADHGRYVDALKSFDEARRLRFDDMIIKNNLAVLDIYQENYQQAFDRLLPLWGHRKSDGQVRANLMLTMAKLGHFDDFRLLADNSLEDVEVIELYQALATSKLQGSRYD